MVSSIVGDRRTQTPTWQWQAWDGLPYLTCSLLQAWPHGFFTQPFYPRLPEALTKILDEQAKTYRVKQVHGKRVLTPDEIESERLTESIVEADGVVANQEKQAIWVASADCTPVLIGDIKTGYIAAIHAGWRGTAKRIVPEAIARLQAWGSSLQDLRIAMGPAISADVYQVDEDVAIQVGSSLFTNEEQTPSESVLKTLEEMSNSPILPDPEPGKVRLNVPRMNQLQLQNLGIQPEQIAIAPYCTYQSPAHFFSYRRTQEKKVQWSGIMVDHQINFNQSPKS